METELDWVTRSVTERKENAIHPCYEVGFLERNPYFIQRLRITTPQRRSRGIVRSFFEYKFPVQRLCQILKVLNRVSKLLQCEILIFEAGNTKQRRTKIHHVEAQLGVLFGHFQVYPLTEW